MIGPRRFYLLVLAPFVVWLVLDPVIGWVVHEWALTGRVDYRGLFSALQWSRRLAMPIVVSMALLLPPVLTLVAARVLRFPASRHVWRAVVWLSVCIASWVATATLIVVLDHPSNILMPLFWSGAAAQSIVAAHAYRLQQAHVAAQRSQLSGSCLLWISVCLQLGWIWPGFLVMGLPLYAEVRGARVGIA